MTQLNLFCYAPRPWLKRLALEALRQPTEIEFDKESLRIYPVRQGVSYSFRVLPVYRVKSLSWLSDFHQLVNSVALHRNDYARAEALVRARLNFELNELEQRFNANERFYEADIQNMLDQVELMLPKSVLPPGVDVNDQDDQDDIPF